MRLQLSLSEHALCDCKAEGLLSRVANSRMSDKKSAHGPAAR